MSAPVFDTLVNVAMVAGALGFFVFWIKSNEETRTVPRARMDLVVFAVGFAAAVAIAGYRANAALAERVWHLAAFYLVYGVSYGGFCVAGALNRIETIRTGREPAPRSPSRDASGGSLVR